MIREKNKDFCTERRNGRSFYIEEIETVYVQVLWYVLGLIIQGPLILPAPDWKFWSQGSSHF